MAIDFSNDAGFVRLYKLSTLVELPDFVKKAGAEQTKSTEQLPRYAFADPLSRTFPIHTKAAAALSYAYFMDQRNEMRKEAASRIDANFEHAAEMWGLRTEFKNIKEGLAKQASTPEVDTSKYALEVGGLKYFPINTTKEVLKSAAELIEHRRNFTYEMRKEAAENIMKAGIARGLATAHIPEPIHKMAGYGMCSKRAAIKEIGRRVLSADPRYKPVCEPLKKMAEHLYNSKYVGPEDLYKVATVLDAFDRETYNTRNYGESVPFPEDMLFHFTEKKASDVKGQHVELITGDTYSLQDLSKHARALGVLGDDFLRDMIEVDGSPNLHKISQALPILPRPDAMVIKRALASLGVHPVSMDRVIEEALN